MRLYQALLRLQFGLTRPIWFGAVVTTLVAYLLPHVAPEWIQPGDDAARILAVTPVSGGILIVCSLAVAFAAGASWAEEGSRNRGVYLMSLPLERWQLAALEYAVAVTLVLGVGAAMLLIGGVYAAVVPLPAGLHAYPVAIAARTTGSALLVLSLLFPLSRLNIIAREATARGTALLAVGSCAVVGWVVLESLGLVSVFGPLVRWAFSSGGPFHLWVGSWMLVDI